MSRYTIVHRYLDEEEVYEIQLPATLKDFNAKYKCSEDKLFVMIAKAMKIDFKPENGETLRLLDDVTINISVEQLENQLP